MAGKPVHLGRFDTAVEAAVAYARAVGEPPALAEEEVAAEVHLSSSNSTGYAAGGALAEALQAAAEQHARATKQETAALVARWMRR